MLSFSARVCRVLLVPQLHHHYVRQFGMHYVHCVHTRKLPKAIYQPVSCITFEEINTTWLIAGTSFSSYNVQ